MDRVRIVHLIAGLVLAASATAVFAGPGTTVPRSRCAPRPLEGIRWQRAASIERGVVVDAAGRAAIDVAALDPCGETAMGRGLLRHLAASEHGAAVVNDLAGPDQLVAVGSSGLEILDTHGEVTHPAWSPDGSLAWSENFETIRLASPDRSLVTTLVPPRGTLGAFAPYFSGNGNIIAVIKEDSPATPAEDDGLNNLWRFDLDAGEWSRITSFRPHRTRWTAIRTPLVAPDGTVYFVKISSDPNATRAPSFELWRARAGRAERVRALDREMFLAGVQGDRLVWNVLSRGCSGWGLAVQVAGGLDPIGCGRVAVDPLETDPDTPVGHDDDDHEGDAAQGGASGAPLAVVVGDFPSPGTAAAVADTLPAGLEGRVVTHDRARGLVRPGAWAVVAKVAPGAHPPRMLRRVRSSLGGCRCSAWLAPLAR